MIANLGIFFAYHASPLRFRRVVRGRSFPGIHPYRGGEYLQRQAAAVFFTRCRLNTTSKKILGQCKPQAIGGGKVTTVSPRESKNICKYIFT